METLAFVDPLPLCVTNYTVINPTTRRIPSLHSKTTISITPCITKKVWKLHAKAKGFGSPASNLQDRKYIRKDDRRKEDNEGGGDDDKIPDEVMRRMIARILFSVGIPFVTGFAFLVMFDAVKERGLLDVPVWLPFLTTFITLGASTLGVVYGALSTNWDGDRESSFLGFEEVQKNWVEMWRE